jgi:hypothetical protein
MKMKLKLLLVFLLLGSMSLSAQKDKEVDMLMFSPVYNTYSPNKISTLILENGKEIKGYRDRVKRKKGQIYFVRLKLENGETVEYDSKDIKEMYLVPGGLEKISKVSRNLTDVRRMSNRNLDSDLMGQGYIFFKKQKVSLKNKKDEEDYLMQLVNADFSKIIEVYGDPFAGQTTSVGIGGFSVAGGLAKSYYVKKGDKIFWLQKKNLDEYYDELFGDNKEFVDKYPKKKIKWRDFSEYVYMYTKFAT